MILQKYRVMKYMFYFPDFVTMNSVQILKKKSEYVYQDVSFFKIMLDYGQKHTFHDIVCVPQYFR